MEVMSSIMVTQRRMPSTADAATQCLGLVVVWVITFVGEAVLRFPEAYPRMQAAACPVTQAVGTAEAVLSTVEEALLWVRQ